ncbi:MAG TPA: hypothetical protein VIP11_18440, partial [Gemmatimonadaceae bacterium]
GASPGTVILTLNDLLDEARITPVSVHRALTRQVILWCVEAYFGQPGVDRGEDVRSDSRELAASRSTTWGYPPVDMSASEAK